MRCGCSGGGLVLEQAEEHGVARPSAAVASGGPSSIAEARLVAVSTYGEGSGRLILVCGLPGAGKTTVATQLEAELGALRLCPDEWMAELGIDLFDGGVRATIEARQWELAQVLLGAGGTVVIEWGLWRRWERDRLRDRARELGAAVRAPVPRGAARHAVRSGSSAREPDARHGSRADRAPRAGRVAGRLRTRPTRPSWHATTHPRRARVRVRPRAERAVDGRQRVDGRPTVAGARACHWCHPARARHPAPGGGRCHRPRSRGPTPPCRAATRGLGSAPTSSTARSQLGLEVRDPPPQGDGVVLAERLDVAHLEAGRAPWRARRRRRR